MLTQQLFKVQATWSPRRWWSWSPCSPPLTASSPRRPQHSWEPSVVKYTEISCFRFSCHKYCFFKVNDCAPHWSWLAQPSPRSPASPYSYAADPPHPASWVSKLSISSISTELTWYAMFLPTWQFGWRTFPFNGKQWWMFPSLESRGSTLDLDGNNIGRPWRVVVFQFQVG